MSYTYEQLVEKIKWLRVPSPEAAQDYLKSLEASAVMAIRVTRSVFGVTMGEAKNIIDRHPAWKSESVRGAEVQESAIDVAENFNFDAEFDDIEKGSVKGPSSSF